MIAFVVSITIQAHSRSRSKAGIMLKLTRQVRGRKSYLLPYIAAGVGSKFHNNFGRDRKDDSDIYTYIITF
jgi:hypothetical protein